MKWVTIISCLFLISFAESKNLYRAYRDAEHVDTIKRASELSAEHLDDVCFAVYAQLVQKATFEEVAKLKDDTVALAKKCAADEHSDPECAKHLHTVILDEICHEQGIAEKYGFTACCAKADPERHDCFLDHKNDSKEYLPPFQRPEPETACKYFHDNRHQTLDYYIYEHARRYPYTWIATFIHGAHEYEKVLTACCQAEDKNACFAEKATAAQKKIKQEIILGKHICSVLKKFGKQELLALKLSALAQKFPAATLETVSKIAHDAVEAHEECCHGDTLDGMIHRDRITEYICSHQESISSKLKGCCEKPKLERAECIIHSENDDKPADLTPTVTEFIQAAACQHYNDNKDHQIAGFTYQYSRRHPELAPVTLKKFANAYKNLLESCCGKEHPETCLAPGEEELKNYVAGIKELTKKHCDQLKQLGPYLYQNELIFLYTKRLPQLPTEHLLAFTKRLVEVGNECCQKDDAHILACAESHVDVALGYACYLHEKHHINKQVCKCCSESYADRRECISHLGRDPEYVPEAFDPKIVTFHEDYCTAAKDIQDNKKQTVLVNLLKHKPDITDEQLAAATVDFAGVVAKCCTEENKEECFGKETPELIERTKASLGEH